MITGWSAVIDTAATLWAVESPTPPDPLAEPNPLPQDVIPPSHTTQLDDYLPWKKLAAAIIEQAVWDYRTVIERGGLAAIRKAHYKKGGSKGSTGRCGGVDDAASAVRFFRGQGFERLCHFVGVSAEGVTDRLRREGSVE